MIHINKKGISAVVAVVLLLMMTVAAAGFAYMWVVGMQKDVQTGTSEQVQAQQTQTQAALAIDSIWSTNSANSSAGNISFTLRNSGTQAFDDVSKFKVYVDGAIVNDFRGSLPQTLIGALAPTSVITVQTNITYPAVGTPKQIKLVAPNGVEVTKRCSSSSITQPSC